ncbi:MAG: hypothetical protein HRT87_05060 [Legionellales bacterium]|nr:hypothetical protein [Legionellales bacterium]
MKSRGFNVVVGYFAETCSGRRFCRGEGRLLIASTKDKMLDYLYMPDEKDFCIKEISLVEVAKGMLSGKSFAFDVYSFKKFSEIANKSDIEGLPEPYFDAKGKDNIFIACDSQKEIEYRQVH